MQNPKIKEAAKNESLSEMGTGTILYVTLYKTKNLINKYEIKYYKMIETTLVVVTNMDSLPIFD